MRSQTKTTNDLLERIALAWLDVFGGMEALTLDGETRTRGKEVDDWAMYSQIALKYNVPHQTVWFVERHNAFVRSVLQRAGCQAMTASLCVGFVAVLGLVFVMHNVLVPVNNYTRHQALLGRQPHFSSPPEGGIMATFM